MFSWSPPSRGPASAGPLIALLCLLLGLHGPTRGFSQSLTMEQGATTPAAGKLWPDPPPPPQPRPRCLVLAAPACAASDLSSSRPHSPSPGEQRPCWCQRTEVPAVGWGMGGAGRVSSLLVFLCEKHHSKALLGQFNGTVPATEKHGHQPPERRYGHWGPVRPLLPSSPWLAVTPARGSEQSCRFCFPSVSQGSPEKQDQ